MKDPQSIEVVMTPNEKDPEAAADITVLDTSFETCQSESSVDDAFVGGKQHKGVERTRRKRLLALGVAAVVVLIIVAVAVVVSQQGAPDNDQNVDSNTFADSASTLKSDVEETQNKLTGTEGPLILESQIDNDSENNSGSKTSKNNPGPAPTEFAKNREETGVTPTTAETPTPTTVTKVKTPISNSSVSFPIVSGTSSTPTPAISSTETTATTISTETVFVEQPTAPTNPSLSIIDSYFQLDSGSFVTCDWATPNSQKIDDRCSLRTCTGDKVEDICPKQCNNEDPKELDQDAVCKFEIVDSNEVVSCNWVLRKESNIKERCERKIMGDDGITMKDACPVQCGGDMPNIAMPVSAKFTPLPTYVPTSLLTSQPTGSITSAPTIIPTGSLTNTPTISRTTSPTKSHILPIATTNDISPIDDNNELAAFETQTHNEDDMDQVTSDLATAEDGPFDGHPTFSFYVTGDLPYSKAEQSILEEQLQKLMVDADSSTNDDGALFVAHVGDILKLPKKPDNCERWRYTDVRDAFVAHSPLPPIVQPGDNDWVDCTNHEEAWEWWSKSFVNLEQEWNGDMHKVPTLIERDDNMMQNFAFVHAGVLILGLDLTVGTGEGQNEKRMLERMDQNRKWFEKQISRFRYVGEEGVSENNESAIRAVICFGHAKAGVFWNKSIGLLKRYNLGTRVPLVYIHGNGHTWAVMKPYKNNRNMDKFWYVQVDQGGVAPPARVTILGTGDGTERFQEVKAGDKGNYQTFGDFIRLDRRGGTKAGPLSTSS